MESENYEILLIEPFYGGSHKVLMDILKEALDIEYGENKICLITLKAKKWHWRARTSALHLSQIVPTKHSFRVLFTSSVLNLAELIALRLDLRNVKKIVYFHENQINYPVREIKERDFQHGYNEVMTCLVSDVVIFNSEFNKSTFLNSIKKYFDILPDCRPKRLKEQIEPKATVLYFPISQQVGKLQKDYMKKLHIVWPHRWEHDKNPDIFLDVIYRLQMAGCQFVVSMIGEQYSGLKEKYAKAETDLKDYIINWGFLDSKMEYLDVLSQAHIAVSTASHEFFGVAMLEAVLNKCFPFCPNSLVYPEIYPEHCLYQNTDDLFNKLSYYSKNVPEIKTCVDNLNFDFSKFSEKSLIPKYIELMK